MTRQLIKSNTPADVIGNRNLNIYVKSIIPVRETHCIHILPVHRIAGKIMRVKNYICFPTNKYEKNNFPQVNYININ